MLGSLIAAGSQLLGGFLGNKAAEKNAERQEALQREFAQSGIQWKVEDAKKAGIHPLYALGANTTSYQPVGAGGGASDFSWLGDAGQNIGRAIQAGSSNNKRAEALALTASQIQLEGLRLDNELKRTQLASAMMLAHQPAMGPGLPGLFTHAGSTGMEGQGDAPQSDVAGVTIDNPAGPHRITMPQFTPHLRAAGRNISPSDWSDAQTYEDRYGEMSDFIMGPMIAYSDWMRNMAPYLRREVYGKLRR